jgi:hypothetical protein
MSIATSHKVIATLAALAGVGCSQGAPESGSRKSASPEPSLATSATALPSASSPVSDSRASPSASAPAPVPMRTCKATRAFSSLQGTEYLALPAQLAIDACAALTAIFPDYDAQPQSSVVAGGTVRAGDGFSVMLDGRAVLALPYYTGEIAEEMFLCGCCTAKAGLALLDVVDGKVSLIAKASKPVEHAGLGTGLKPSSAQLVFDDKESLITLETAHTCGTAPLRRYLHAFRVANGKLAEVLDWRVGARGTTGVADISEVTATVTNAPATSASKGPRELVFTWQRALCPFDDKAGDYLCGQPTPAGSERLHFNGNRYVLNGPRAKLEHFDE